LPKFVCISNRIDPEQRQSSAQLSRTLHKEVESSTAEQSTPGLFHSNWNAKLPSTHFRGRFM